MALRDGGGAQGPARLRVRRARRRDRRDPPLRDRAGGLRAARDGLHRAGAAREPRRARGGRRTGRCPSCHASPTCAGDLHCHTTASDGTASIEEMARGGARDAGYEYLAITDHSASMGFGADVSPDELREQIERIRAIDASRRASSCSPARRSTSSPTARSTTTTSCWPSSTGWSRRVHSSFRMDSERDDRADRARDREPAGRRDRPPDRPQDRATPAVRVRLRRGARGGRARPARCSRSTPAPTAATSTRSTRAPRRPPGSRS